MPILGSPSGRTVANLIDTVKTKLTGGQPDKRDKLAIALTDSASDTDVQLTYNDESVGIQRGAIIEVQRELLYVWDVDSNTTPDTLTVERGYGGTTIGAHPSGTVITERPSYRRADIYDALLAEVQSLNGSGLYVYQQVDLTHSNTSSVYALDAPDLGSFIGVYAVDYDTSGLQGMVGKGKARLLSNLPVGDYPSGFGLQLLAGGQSGQAMRAIVMTTFDEFTAEADVVGQVCGVPSYAEMALVWGAAEQLMLPDEARRNQVRREHGSRNPGEVQAQANAVTANQFRARKQDALQRALLRQRSEFPIRNTA